MDEYAHKIKYDHPRSQKQRAEKKIKTQNSVEILGAKHSDQKAEQGRRHYRESQQHQRKIENEKARDITYHAGRGDREHEKERRELDERHKQERNDLAVRQDREMAAAKAKAAKDLD